MKEGNALSVHGNLFRDSDIWVCFLEIFEMLSRPALYQYGDRCPYFISHISSFHLILEWRNDRLMIVSCSFSFCRQFVGMHMQHLQCEALQASNPCSNLIFFSEGLENRSASNCHQLHLPGEKNYSKRFKRIPLHMTFSHSVLLCIIEAVNVLCDKRILKWPPSVHI